MARVNSGMESNRSYSIDYFEILSRILQMRKYDLSHSSELEQIRSTSSFMYQSIPLAFRLGRSPFEQITLYKGAQSGLENAGFPSDAFEHGKIDKIEEAKRIIYSGVGSEIRKLFDNHTSGKSMSALLSTTYNPEMAQVFAPHSYGSDYTIYEIKVNANRCVLDKYDTGHCGKSGEVLILGAIFSDEISAVKIKNTDRESELLFTDFQGACWIRETPEPDSHNRVVKNSRNWIRR